MVGGVDMTSSLVMMVLLRLSSVCVTVVESVNRMMPLVTGFVGVMSFIAVVVSIRLKRLMFSLTDVSITSLYVAVSMEEVVVIVVAVAFSSVVVALSEVKGASSVVAVMMSSKELPEVSIGVMVVMSSIETVGGFPFNVVVMMVT